MIVHKKDFCERRSVHMCVTDIVSPLHHRTTHCRKNGNGAIIVGLSSTAGEEGVPILLTHRR